MADLTVSRHQGPLDELAAEWAPLIDAAHPGAPFRSFPWVSFWWQFASTSLTRHVLVAREGARVAGILPLYGEPTLLGGLRLRLMGDGMVGSDYQGALAQPSDAVRVAHAFYAHLRRAGDSDE